MKPIFPAILILLCASVTLSLRPAPRGTAQYPQTSSEANSALRGVHDPCLIKCGRFYYLFSTGPGIPIRRSNDLIHWEFAGRVFNEDVPDWAKQKIPGSSSLWAPDISFSKGRYRLYYAVSRFGSNRSLIGLASNKTLDASQPDYHWQDEGEVIASGPEQNYNAIDPNVLTDAQNHAVLTFGSFWSGIKLVSIDAKTGKLAPNASVVSLAQRPAPPDAIEAPFLIRHRDYYYLFVSFDFCCRGVHSTYNIRVGRAAKIGGPYLDHDGKSLQEGGGTVVLATQGDVIGPGHCAILREGKRDYLVHHFYDGAAQGVPTLQVRPLTWTPDGWPIAGKPLT